MRSPSPSTTRGPTLGQASFSWVPTSPHLSRGGPSRGGPPNEDCELICLDHAGDPQVDRDARGYCIVHRTEYHAIDAFVGDTSTLDFPLAPPAKRLPRTPLAWASSSHTAPLMSFTHFRCWLRWCVMRIGDHLAVQLSPPPPSPDVPSCHIGVDTVNLCYSKSETESEIFWDIIHYIFICIFILVFIF